MSITVLDVGGTHLRSARWSAETGLGEVRRVPTPGLTNCPHATVGELRAALVEAMAEAVPAGGVAGVSFGAALDHRSGVVHASAPLWGPHVEPFDLRGALRSARPDVRWHVVNDVTAALLHLAASPHADGRRKILLATISTGVACRTLDTRTGGIPLDSLGLQGEIGHLPATVTLDGEPVELRCDCGQPGHVAAFASGTGLRRLSEVFRDRHRNRWARSRLAAAGPFETTLRSALDDADPVAVELLRTAVKPVADVVRTALCLDPEIDLVAFTGGVATGLGRHYRDALTCHLTADGLYLTGERDPGWVLDRILVCEPDEANGLVGAGLAAHARTTHRAVVRAGGSVSVRPRATSEPGPGELVVATEYAGLCGTDIQMLRGLRDDPAPVIGHEGIATVVAAGAGVPAEFAVGTLVAVNPTHPADPGFLLGHNVDGLLQERTLLPASAVDGGLVLPLPADTDRTLGPLLEPLAVVRYALGELRAFAPRTLIVYGDGVIGHLAVRAARRTLGSATRVVLVHHTQAGLAFSEAAPYRADVLCTRVDRAHLGPGAVGALLATPRDATVSALEAVLSLGAGELAVDIVGGLPPAATTPLLPGVDLTAARAANCGGLPDPARVVTTEPAVGHRVHVFGHRGVAARHLLDAAGELAAVPERYRDLITHETDLEGAARVMRTLSGSRERMIDGRRLVKLSVRIGAGK
ncbi:ROK family protein [Amycolatopsis kentuckyensis]|uniref:ROK family protein n=1 Tax=Amycolatopsis kentuckyensis TaxID=218823 RepID=UPI001302AA66|nr:ROK family protein [Amycolatopsis kentuckyensis]